MSSCGLQLGTESVYYPAIYLCDYRAIVDDIPALPLHRGTFPVPSPAAWNLHRYTYVCKVSPRVAPVTPDPGRYLVWVWGLSLIPRILARGPMSPFVTENTTFCIHECKPS